jgi:glucan phosphoethanolaminetransferase (alkaline phosphatase superfamily)
MRPLSVIYWTRAALGVVIGVLCAAYLYMSVSRELASIFTFFTGLSFAMLFYIATFYVIKFKFLGKVEKQQKLMMQGIGMYFFAWLVSWILVVSLLLPSVSVSIYVNGEAAEGRTFWVVARNIGGGVIQNVTTTAGSFSMALISPGNYTFQLGGSFENETVSGQNQELVLGWLQSPVVSFDVTQSPG